VTEPADEEVPVTSVAQDRADDSVPSRPGRDASRRQSLLAAAERAVARDGLMVSVNAIAAEAGITKPVLYRHFGGKDGLYRALAERHTERLLTTLRDVLVEDGDRRERTARAISAYLGAIEKAPHIYRLLMYGSADEPAMSGQVTLFVRRISEELARRMTFELRLPPSAQALAHGWAHAVAGLVRGAGDWWLETGGLTRAELTDMLTDMLWGTFTDPLRALAANPPAADPHDD
jgi:AcrR family transcriptional regulator